jgi:ribosomal protein S18 acetylase RimI-like enzyme
MSIQPQFRNQGIGSRMMYTVEDDLNQCFFLQVTLKVGQDNLAARRFYDRLGYIIVSLDPGRWPYIDDKGKRRDVHEPPWRMIKKLD